MNHEMNEINQFDRPVDFSSFGLDSHDPMYSSTEKDRAAVGNPPEHLDLENWESKAAKREAGAANTSTTQQWIKQFSSYNDDYSRSIAKDKDGNLYLTGSTDGNLAGMAGESGYDAWVAKYDSNGDRLWIKQFGSFRDDYSNALATDNNGNVYLTGYTYGDMAGTNAGSADIWVVKYDSKGDRIWTKQFGSSYIDESKAIATDNNGNIYLNGSTNGDLAGANADESRFSDDIWMAKYDSEGNQIWTKQFGSSENDYSGGIATDSNGNICSIGSTFGDLAGGTNAGGIIGTWIAKYDGNGERLWARQFDSSDFSARSRAIVTDSSDNIYISGATDRNLGGINVGMDDVWVAKYDSKGEQSWIKQFGSSGSDYSEGIATDNNGNIYLTGYTNGDLAEKNAGMDDVWVAKYDNSGNQVWTKQFGSSSWDYAQGIVADNSGNVYLTGSTYGDLASKNPDRYRQDTWIAKINPIAQSKVSISATDAFAAETASGKTRNSGEFTIARTGDISNPLTINYSLNGKATNGEDYQEVTSKVIIPTGRNEVFLHLEIFDDIYSEYPEKVNATIEPNIFYKVDTAKSATVTIADNDKPVVSISAIDASSAETKTGETPNPARLKVSRAGDLSNPLTVAYNVNGTATKSTDYKLPTKMTFPAGVNTVGVPINIFDDALVEGQETANIILTSSPNYNLAKAKIAKVAIADNDR
jgi:Beta-propeller repeat/Calx-beta domain